MEDAGFDEKQDQRQRNEFGETIEYAA